MVNGGPFLELFGRPHNARQGWMTIGNEAIEYHPEYYKQEKYEPADIQPNLPPIQAELAQNEIFNYIEKFNVPFCNDPLHKFLYDEASTWVMPPTQTYGSIYEPPK